MNAHPRHPAVLDRLADFRVSARVAAAIVVLAALCPSAAAQNGVAVYSGPMNANGSGSSVSASVMWSTSSGGSNVSSAQMHQLAGDSAASVEMARKGILYLNGASIAVQAIGAQTIVSTTIIGDGNAVDVDAVQDAHNTGDVSVRDVTIRDIGL
ncbi:MAG: hypothetical protein KUL79_14215 [Thauera sp.]|nr:hypothetical protein [Thauera sp.]